MAANETTPLREDQGIGAYKRSKITAERLVEAMVAERGLPAVIVNPSTPIGPRDVRPTPTGRIIIEAAKGRIPAFIDTGLNLVHVDDVASGHLAALRHGKIGERYILGGQDVLFSQMLRDIAGRGRASRGAGTATLAGRHSVCLCRRSHRQFHGAGALCNPGWGPHGKIPHVLRLNQGRAGTGIPLKALYRGDRRRRTLVSRGRIPGILTRYRLNSCRFTSKTKVLCGGYVSSAGRSKYGIGIILASFIVHTTT